VTRLLLVDDHALVRAGLRSLLESAGFEVVGEAADGREAVSVALRTRPEVVVMDVVMPVLNGVDATRRLVGELPGVRVIGLSGFTDERSVVAMFEAGARGYLLKDSLSDELIEAVRAVAGGLDYVSPVIASVVVQRVVASGESTTDECPLSLREREVLQLLAEGRTSKQIASSLSLAVPTVETHRRQIMEKLGLRNVAELTKYAIRAGLTSLER
jgi:DNA-binding NarL/FixJ family response regulator